MRVAIYLLSGCFVLAAFSLLYESARAHRRRIEREVEQLRAQLVARDEEVLTLRQRAPTTAAAAPAARDHCPPAAATTATTTVATAAVAQRSYVHDVTALPFRADDLVMMTYATGGVRELLHNWVHRIKQLGLPILVAAMDDEVLALCTSLQFDCVDCRKTSTSASALPTYIRGDFGGFRALGVRKVDALLEVLRAGVHVVLSDVDCVWSGDPNPMVRGQLKGYEAFAHADVLVATDCMEPEADWGDDGCYSTLIDKNTGVLAVRATPNGIKTMAEWRVRLAVGQKDEQDQTTFMDLLDGNGRGHRWGMSPRQRSDHRSFASTWCASLKGNRLKGFAVRSSTTVAGSRRIFDVCLPNVTRDLRLGVFPTTHVAGGHTFFVQQLQRSTGLWPMAVHATYQYGDMSDYAFGKRQRFRDWGMWHVDRPDEMVGGDARYLVLEDDAPLAAGVAWQPHSDIHARGRQHVEHLDRLRQRLAHGVALARALDRVVVLPTLWCYCDKYWHRLDQCAVPMASSSQPLPFVCPMDHVVDPAHWHGVQHRRERRKRRGMLASRADGEWEEGMPYRGPYWLRTLGAHPEVGMSSATLATALPRGAPPVFPTPRELLAMTRSGGATAAAAATADVRHAFLPGAEGPHLLVPPNRSAEALRRSLDAYRHVRLLKVSLSDADALLRCYDEPKAAADVARLVQMIFQHKWCYRPKEMLPEWVKLERTDKQKAIAAWCVWGFKQPQTKAACSKG